MLMLGAIVSPPFQVPERGVVVGIVLLFTVLLMQRSLSLFVARNARAELLTQGAGSTVVKDGVVLVGKLRQARLSQEQLFPLLRSEDIRHLGELQRVYLEGSGTLSVFKAKRAKPGLSVLPLMDEALQRAIPGRKTDGCAATVAPMAA